MAALFCCVYQYFSNMIMEHQAKGTAIIAGYAAECGKSDKPFDPARDFADLLAQVTSPNAKIREIAKEKIRRYAGLVAFKSSSSGVKNVAGNASHKSERTCGKIDHEFPNKGKKWEFHDEKKLLATWDSEVTLEDMSPRFGRTAGALCAKLADLGNHGDRESIRAENVRRGGVYGS